MCINMGVRKFGPFKCQKSGNRGMYLLSLKKMGFIMYLAALKKGAIRHAHPYCDIYIANYPPPPPHTHTHTPLPRAFTTSSDQYRTGFQAACTFKSSNI